MKSIKYSNRYGDIRFFRYVDEITQISYGIQNTDNIVIGYCYKNQQKGFWIGKFKL
jgi:hypothetical protein